MMMSTALEPVQRERDSIKLFVLTICRMNSWALCGIMAFICRTMNSSELI